MSAKFFLDTNLLVYSFEEGELAKQDRARQLIEQALETRQGVISWQVVQEFLNVALHKWQKPMTAADAREFLQAVLNPLCTVYPSAEIWNSALRIAEESQYRFYDTLIVASAIQSGATILYSEDLQDGRRFGPLQVRNPFK